MAMTLGEIRDLEYKESREREKRKQEELEKELKIMFSEESIDIKHIRDDEDCYRVNMLFTIDGYEQDEVYFWMNSESKEDFLEKVKNHIGYIKELRKKYPEYCKQNDFIQTNRDFKKGFNLTHMGYKRTFELNLKLADFLKLPNTTDTGFGGGDYEIKRTPKRVEEYNKNIDIAIDTLLDCIAELKQRKYVNY